MLDLILVRRAETADPVINKHIGITDVPLSERGKKQALSLSRTFAREKLDAVYTSPLRRARDTAEPIAKALGLPLDEESGLCDRNYGLWEEMTMEEIQDKYPEQQQEWYRDWLEYEIPHGESELAVYERNAETLRHILEKHETGKILIVAHMGGIRNMLSLLLNMNVEGGWHFQPNCAGICRLRIDEYGFAELVSFNEI